MSSAFFRPTCKPISASLPQLSAGAVPPVSFHPDLELICDPTLFTRYSELAFNAGSRDVSIIISTDDFKRIVAPKVADFPRDAVSAPAEKQNQ